MKTEPQKEHQWLHKLAGEWSYEGEALCGPDKPAEKFRGTETVRTLGGLWMLCEGQGEMPGGEPATTLMTLGWDPHTKRYCGTWVGSMMAHLWIYDGSLDAAGRVLTLEAEGPDFEAPGKLAKYRDVIEFRSDDHRVLSSHLQGANGEWTQFMTAHYRRKW